MAPARNMDWAHVSSSEKVSTLIEFQGRKIMYFVGTRIHMKDGSWWFVSNKSGSWTLHFKPRQETDMFFRPVFDESGEPIMAKEMKNRWDDLRDLKRDLGRRNPRLVIRLYNAWVTAQ